MRETHQVRVLRLAADLLSFFAETMIVWLASDEPPSS